MQLISQLKARKKAFRNEGALSDNCITKKERYPDVDEN